MTLDMKWVAELSPRSPAPLRRSGDDVAGGVWEEIIKLQTLEMRLLLWPRQSSLFVLTTALCSLIAVIEAVIASCKMTFPLLFWRDELHSVVFSLSLFLSLLQHFMTPLNVFLSIAEMEKMFVNIPVSLTLLLNSVIFKLGNKVEVMKLFSSLAVWHVTVGETQVQIIDLIITEIYTYQFLFIQNSYFLTEWQSENLQLKWNVLVAAA